MAEETAPQHSPEGPRRRPTVAVPRWVQLVALPLAIVAFYMILRAAGSVLLLFVIAGLVALLLNPIVELLHRLRVPRGLATVIVVLALLAAITGIGFLLANPITDQVSGLRDTVPDLVHSANRSLANLQGWMNRNGIDIQIKKEGQTALQTLGDRVTGGTGDVVSFTRDAVQTLVEGVLSVVLVVVLAVYMLVYGDRIGHMARTLVPAGDGSRGDDFPSRIQSALFGYVRAQLLFSLIMGTSAGLALWILGSLGVFPDGRTYAVAFGAFYAFAELIPYVGPAIGAAPPVLIALFSDTPLDAVWLVILFVVLQQLEGHIVVPQVFGQALRINPLLVIFALLLGGKLAGFIGAFIALPIASIVRECIAYMYEHLYFERWDLPAVAPGTLDSRRPAPADAGDGATSCPECGAPVTPGALYCAACGTELADSDAAASAAASAPG
jgi:predicted PurR-regulated permease PerM